MIRRNGLDHLLGLPALRRSRAFPRLTATQKRRLAERGIDAERSFGMLMLEIRDGGYPPRLLRDLAHEAFREWRRGPELASARIAAGMIARRRRRV